MGNKCTALLENNIITANLPMNFDIFQKITEVEINFKNVIGLKNEELAEFSKFLKTSLKNEGKPIKITDVKKMYHIKTLRTRSESIWSISKKIFYACITILLTFGLVMIIKQIWKCTHKTNPKFQGKFHRLELRQFFENKSGGLNEERCDIDSNEANSQVSPSDSDKIVHFPSLKIS